MLCVVRSLFLHPTVRNKMWGDFGRIASTMILSKVLSSWVLLSLGDYGMVDAASWSSSSLQTRFS